MASLSRKIRLQQCSWQLLEDLAFCGERTRRLADLAAEVLFEQQCQRPVPLADPELEVLLPW